MKKQKTVPKDIDKTIQLATIYSNDVELPRKKAMKRSKKFVLWLHNITDLRDDELDLLTFIKLRGGHITFYESLACDWRFLGGLFTIGLVQWTARKIGGEYVRCVEPVRK